MHAIFCEKAEEALGKQATAVRCQFVSGDIASEAGTADALMRRLAMWDASGGYDMTLSAFALHHLTTSEKREVYQRIHDVLKPGGLFINADLFTYHSPTLARLATDFGLNWIRTQ